MFRKVFTNDGCCAFFDGGFDKFMPINLRSAHGNKHAWWFLDTREGPLPLPEAVRDVSGKLRQGQLVIDLVRAFGPRVSDGQSYEGICW